MPRAAPRTTAATVGRPGRGSGRRGPARAAVRRAAARRVRRRPTPWSIGWSPRRSPAWSRTAGPRFFGFVIGGVLAGVDRGRHARRRLGPVRLQRVLSPAARAAEEAAGGWLKDLLGIPRVRVRAGSSPERRRPTPSDSPRPATTCSPRPAGTSNATACPALRGCGWSRAPSGTPRSTARCGCSASATRVVELRASTDANGAIDVDALAAVLADGPAGPMIVCLQAGQREHRRVRRPARRLRRGARARWLGARGRRVRAVGGGQPGAPAPHRRRRAGRLVGMRRAQVAQRPVRLGLRVLSRPDVHSAATSYTAPYLTALDRRPRAGRPGARVVAPGAGFHRLGRAPRARPRRASPTWSTAAAPWPAGSPTGCAAGGLEVANDVVLNQVLVGFGDDERTDRVIAAIQRDGTCWMGGTTWHGRRLMRISVSNWSTTDDDVDRSRRGDPADRGRGDVGRAGLGKETLTNIARLGAVRGTGDDGPIRRARSPRSDRAGRARGGSPRGSTGGAARVVAEGTS